MPESTGLVSAVFAKADPCYWCFRKQNTVSVSGNVLLFNALMWNCFKFLLGVIPTYDMFIKKMNLPFLSHLVSSAPLRIFHSPEEQQGAPTVEPLHNANFTLDSSVSVVFVVSLWWSDIVDSEHGQRSSCTLTSDSHLCYGTGTRKQSSK